MRADHQQRQTQSQRIAPKLIMASNILQLSSQELRQAVEQELAENPALESPDESSCTNCELAPGQCGECPLSRAEPQEKSAPVPSIFEFERITEQNLDDEASDDFISNLSSAITLQEHLLSSARATVDEDKRPIAEYIISHINDSGYLETSVEQISLDLNVDMVVVTSALAAVQSLDPPGVGARDLRECLSVQLSRLAEDSRGNDVASSIVAKCWKDMLGGRQEKIARRLKVSMQEVLDAVSFIRRSLTPYPGNCFRETFGSEISTTNDSIRADVVVRRTSRGFNVDVVSYDAPTLTINPRYLTMYEEIRNGAADKYTRDEKEHIVAFVDRAKAFLKHLEERRKTLKKITEFVVDFQQGFFETDSRTFLRPLTRTGVARKMNMHESTVSRATQGKYVQLPTQEVIPFETLFDSSAAVRDAIVRLIAAEDPLRPLSDDEIATVLAREGFEIARRTVQKYRESEKLLSSRRRRRV